MTGAVMSMVFFGKCIMSYILSNNGFIIDHSFGITGKTNLVKCPFCGIVWVTAGSIGILFLAFSITPTVG
jgi:hypothetical protein